MNKKTETNEQTNKQTNKQTNTQTNKKTATKIAQNTWRDRLRQLYWSLSLYRQFTVLACSQNISHSHTNRQRNTIKDKKKYKTLFSHGCLKHRQTQNTTKKDISIEVINMDRKIYSKFNSSNSNTHNTHTLSFFFSLSLSLSLTLAFPQ